MVAAPARVLLLQNRFRIGGGERQTVLHLATVDRARWEPLVRVLTLDGEHLSDLARLGVAPRSLDVRGLLRPSALLAAARLAREVRRERVALVHAQDFYANLLGALAARLAGVPVAVTRVDLMHHLDRPRRAALRAVSLLADRVVVNALAIRDLCVAEGVAPERVVVIRNGVDLAGFDRAVAGAGRPRGDGSTVVNVANMHHAVKGHEDLLRAFAALRRRVPAVRLVLVGDGERRASLERLAGALGAREAVVFTGQRRDVPAILAAAEVVVSASHAEGLSNAILEGMAARRPVVATAVGGSPELVVHGESGLLVPPHDPGALAAALLQLLRDPARARRMGASGRARVQREFGLERMRAAYDALYAGMTTSPRTATATTTSHRARAAAPPDAAAQLPLPGAGERAG